MAPAEAALSGLLSSARASDHATAVTRERVVRWSEFKRCTARLARFIAASQAQRWVLACADPLVFAAALFAAWHAGKTAVIPPGFQAGTLRSLALADDAVLDDETAASAPDSPFEFQPLDAARAQVELYTSGSSGRPQRVVKQLRQLEAEVETLECMWGRMMANAAIVSTVPHHHIYGLLFHLLWPLAYGRAFDTEAAGMPDALCERVQALRDTVIVASPARLARFPELGTLTALRPSPRLIFCSGGPLPATAVRSYVDALGMAPVEVYGSTETGGLAWRQQPTPDSAWTPLPGVRVARATDGALLVSSPHLTQGVEARVEDEVQLLDDGRFVLRGRLDRVVKIEEKRVSLPEIEGRLRAHPWVRDAAVIALRSRRHELAAAIVLSEDGAHQMTIRGKRAMGRALRESLSAFYDPVLLPRRWRFPAELPRNERGKVAQYLLRALFAKDNHGPVAT